MMFSMCLDDGPTPTAIRVIKDQIASTESRFDAASDDAYRGYTRKMLMQLYYTLGTLLLSVGPEDRLLLVSEGDVSVPAAEGDAAAARSASGARAEADAAVYDEAAFYLAAAIEAAPGHSFAEAEDALAVASSLLGGGGDAGDVAGPGAAFFDADADAYDEAAAAAKYAVPDLVAAAVSARMSWDRGLQTYRRALDVGCGTGLVGLELRGLAEKIDGLDLSARAAAAARGRRHWDDSLPLYGTVAVGDFLRGAPPVEAAAYDLVVAADVAPFYGPLDDVVRGLAALVEPEGDLVLSLDTAEDGSTKGVGYVARPENRYAHEIPYAIAVLESRGLEVLTNRGLKGPGREAGGTLVPSVAIVCRSPGRTLEAPAVEPKAPPAAAVAAARPVREAAAAPPPGPRGQRASVASLFATSAAADRRRSEDAAARAARDGPAGAAPSILDKCLDQLDFARSRSPRPTAPGGAARSRTAPESPRLLRPNSPSSSPPRPRPGGPGVRPSTCPALGPRPGRSPRGTTSRSPRPLPGLPPKKPGAPSYALLRATKLPSPRARKAAR